VDPPAGLVEALGAGTPRWVGRGRFDYLVELEDEAAVRGLRPDPRRLGRLTPWCDRVRLGGRAVTVLRGQLA
jgi:predicted PhzF superfamily epimerase YddE/YHI9